MKLQDVLNFGNLTLRRKTVNGQELLCLSDLLKGLEINRPVPNVVKQLISEHSKDDVTKSTPLLKNDEDDFTAKNVINKNYDGVPTKNPTSKNVNGVYYIECSDKYNRIVETIFVDIENTTNLILMSRKKTAVKYKRWLISTVIPSIEKYGGYIVGQEDVQSYEELKQLIKDYEKQVAETLPFVKAVEESNETMYVRDLATIVNQGGVTTGQNRLFALLRNKGLLNKYNYPTAKASNNNYIRIEYVHTANGRWTKVPKITGKGCIYIFNLIMNNSSDEEKMNMLQLSIEFPNW